MRMISAAAVAVLALASHVFAADAPIYSPEPVASSSDWSGLYAGVVGTAGSVTASHLDVDWWYHGSTFDQDFAAYGIGATAGFNTQSGNLVYGIEADISWLSGSEAIFYSDEVDYETGIDALATLRARVGFTVDNALFYGTAGLAAASLNFDWNEESGEFWNSDDWAFGYTVGAGVEYALDENISLKAEYLHAAFYPDTAYVSNTSWDEDPAFELSATASLFRGGVNFKF